MNHNSARASKRTRDQHETEEDPIPSTVQNISCNNFGTVSTSQGMLASPSMLENPSQSNHQSPQSGTYSPKKFNPSKQHFHELVKAGLVLTGDELRYAGKSYVNCTIMISAVHRTQRPLSVSITFTPTAYASSPSNPQPKELQLHRSEIEGPTYLENILLENYGVDIASLPIRWRTSWPLFSVIRNGQNLGTLAQIRTELGMKRIQGDPEVTSKFRKPVGRWAQPRKYVKKADGENPPMGDEQTQETFRPAKRVRRILPKIGTEPAGDNTMSSTPNEETPLAMAKRDMEREELENIAVQALILLGETTEPAWMDPTDLAVLKLLGKTTELELVDPTDLALFGLLGETMGERFVSGDGPYYTNNW